MSVLNDWRVARVGYGYEIQTSVGRYWTEEYDVDQPSTWRAYTSDDGEWILDTSDPLAKFEPATRKYTSAEELVAAVLAYDGQDVSA